MSDFRLVIKKWHASLSHRKFGLRDCMLPDSKPCRTHHLRLSQVFLPTMLNATRLEPSLMHTELESSGVCASPPSAQGEDTLA